MVYRLKKSDFELAYVKDKDILFERILFSEATDAYCEGYSFEGAPNDMFLSLHQLIAYHEKTHPPLNCALIVSIRPDPTLVP